MRRLPAAPTVGRAVTLALGIVLLLGALAPAVAQAVNGGDLDPSFGGDGKLTTDFSGFGYPDVASAVAIQADGKIVAAGDALGGFGLARYNPDGSLDTSFAGDGTRWTAFGSGESSAASAVAIQADGKVVAVGAWDRGAGNYDFALARYNPDGSLDTSFSGDGKRTQGFGGSDRAHGVVLQADGKIVVAGIGDGDFALARYNPNGSLDTSFAGDGTLTTPFFDDTSLAHAVAIQADGRIVAAGARVTSSDFDFALARYNPDGSLDTSFDGDGKSNSFSAGASAVAIQADGRIVAAGTAVGDFVLARYNPYGGLDPSFSDDGRLTTDFGANDLGAGLAIQADGRIVVAGTADGDFALARYHAITDNAAPETTITSGPTALSADPAPTFAFGSSELGSTFQCSLDGAAFSPCGSPHTPAALADGPHGFRVRAIDAVENVDPTPAERDFTVDTTSPRDDTVTIEIKGRRAKLGRNRRVIVRLACPAQEASPPCSGTLRLRTARKIRLGGKKRRRELAERRYSIGAGETRGLKLRLSKRKAELVRSQKRARRVKAGAEVTDRAGNRATAVKEIGLRPTARGRKRGGRR
jgi:uncharacterized delta-60 repeat protein